MIFMEHNAMTETFQVITSYFLVEHKIIRLLYHPLFSFGGKRVVVLFFVTFWYVIFYILSFFPAFLSVVTIIW